MTALPGFAEGAWWVQDTAAALPARLIGDDRRPPRRRSLRGARRQNRAACGRGRHGHSGRSRAGAAASGLKTISPGCRSKPRLVCANVAEWQAEPFDAVLLDAPCSSTGTIRRHPDVPWLKQRRRHRQARRPAAPSARARGRADQARRHADLLHLFARARGEREHRRRILAREPGVRRSADCRQRSFRQSEFITTDGDLRTLPCHFPMPIRGSPASMASTPRGW